MRLSKGGRERQKEKSGQRRKRETGSRPLSAGGALGLRPASGAPHSFQLRALRAACNPPTPLPPPYSLEAVLFLWFGYTRCYFCFLFVNVLFSYINDTPSL